ncbi:MULTISPECIES: ROK family protein [unclassified Curtobacterium]|uniref:ROK family protein n=1 Tax=unclassified Curtobacterium TaxID=257496 RepID=UPI000D954C2F|nr:MULTISPECIES: ROK family protein [unclassified Curtobacterium]PYY40082.1 ROK family protein [Curtobacterium sp. MCPF17_046]WIB16418.1 ROK family protein [Curtobacterium sp. MCPF17_050]
MRIGLDIGGTKIDAVAVAPSGAVLDRVRVPTGSGPDAVVANTLLVIRSLTERTGRTATSVGIGIPGLIDPETGWVRHAVNLGLSEVALGPIVADTLGLRVQVENDVNVAALGAAQAMQLDGPQAYLNIGTGLAAGLVVDRRLWRGARGNAGEIGHIPVLADGLPCVCGQRGCLETVASGSALAVAWPGHAGSAATSVFDCADAGDPAAVAVRDRFVAGVASAVRILVVTADVESVVIGGGLASLGERLLVPLRADFDEAARSSPFVASLGLSSRVLLAPADQPLAALGAAFLAPESAVTAA